MNFKQTRGFTLLELLVVIAIIGILAATVMMALSDTKDKGGDAAVKSNLVNARSHSAVFYSTSTPASYTNLCTDPTMRRLVQAAARAGGVVPNASAYALSDVGSWNVEVCHGSGTGYAVWVPLKSSTVTTSDGWCIDSNNSSKRVTVAGATGLAANAVACP